VVDRSPKLARAGIAATVFASARRVAIRFALTRPAGRGLLVVALVAGVGLAGCGRKAGLDAPPMAAAGDQQAGQPGSAPSTASGTTQASTQALGPDGKPTSATTDKRRTLFDWLLN
jgi:predicted small lipoprotein YifL